jgi:hypothetical protein
MSQERDVTRLFRSWIREDQHESADQVLGAVLDRLDTTPQLRSWWPARRSNRMNGFAKLLAAAAAVLLVAVVGYQFLPTQGGVGGEPTVAPSPSPSLLARGTFTLYDAEVVLDATGAGDHVTGTMAVSHEDGDFTVDLKCTRTTEDGVILIAGDITDSASPYARQGAREVIILKPGSPVFAGFDSEGREGGDVKPAASCPALLEQVIETGTQTVVGPNGLEPIEETVEFGP